MFASSCVAALCFAAASSCSCWAQIDSSSSNSCGRYAKYDQAILSKREIWSIELEG